MGECLEKTNIDLIKIQSQIREKVIFTEIYGNTIRQKKNLTKQFSLMHYNVLKRYNIAIKR